MALAWSSAQPMRVAVVTKIFPNSLEPLSAPFNRHQIGELARRCEVDVLVAIPHVPFSHVFAVPERAARLAALPARERVHGVDVTYVRQLYVPRVGLPVAVPLYLASLRPHVERLRTADVLLATWAYPDGCAAVWTALALDKPCVVKVHGSDVNTVLQRRAARLIGARVLPRADAVIAVSRPLAAELVQLGVPRERVHVVPNGVDTSLFYPRDRAASRLTLCVPDDARLVLFVGRLEPQKGLGELLEAFAVAHRRVPGAMLVLIGDGASADEARARSAAFPRGAVRVVGPRPHEDVAMWLGACDVLALPSWAEGTPNVILEALASGRPAVATAVGGIPDVLADPRAGIVVPPKNPAALAEALCDALCRQWDPPSVRACGPASWTESAARLQSILDLVTSARRSSRTRANQSKQSNQNPIAPFWKRVRNG
ncbi:MAG: glycosyltransferase family 4 protein [Polyangiaceae bacterium]